MTGPKKGGRSAAMNAMKPSRMWFVERVPTPIPVPQKFSTKMEATPRPDLSLLVDSGRVYKRVYRLRNMFRRRPIAFGILLSALVGVLFWGLITAELPELLSLTDNTSNDFSICRANSSSFLDLRDTKIFRIVAVGFKNSEPHGFVSHLITFEKAVLVPSDLLILYSVLRT